MLLASDREAVSRSSTKRHTRGTRGRRLGLIFIGKSMEGRVTQGSASAVSLKACGSQNRDTGDGEIGLCRGSEEGDNF